MIERAAAGVGKTRDVPDRRIEVEVWTCSVTSPPSPSNLGFNHEYLHLVRSADGWKIVNALWQRSARQERRAD
jgi:hypothetical protein